MSYNDSSISSEFACKCGRKTWVTEGKYNSCLCGRVFIGKYSESKLTIIPVYVKDKRYEPFAKDNT